MLHAWAKGRDQLVVPIIAGSLVSELARDIYAKP